MTEQLNPKNIVLYADDDTDDVELVQESFLLYSNNVEVIAVKDGSQALSYLQRLGEDDRAPCLIILDVNMPFINGREVLVKLRAMKKFESTPVVLFTTSSLPQDEHFAKKYNAGFVTKPLDVAQMEVITEFFIDHCAEEIKKNIRKHLL